VFFEPTATAYGAHVPDLPGCIAAGRTLEETRQLIREAIEFHIEGMRLHGEAVPEPTKHIEQVEIPACSSTRASKSELRGALQSLYACSFPVM